MFTLKDYKLIRESNQRAKELGGAWEPLPDEKAATARMNQHIKQGLPKPEGVPQEWWDFEVEIYHAS